MHAVLTYKDVPRVPHTTAGQAWPEPSPYDTYLLDSKVRFVGDRVAAVAAESRAIAEQALRLIEVDYEVLPAVLDMEQAMAPGAPVIHDEPDSTKIYDRERNIAGYILREIGNVEEGFREADYVIEREFRTQRQQHCPMEPHVTISWLDADNRLVIRTSTQVPYHCRRQVAMILQIPVSRIHVIKPRIGGGFGGKQEMLLEDICGALALATRRPVKIEYTRAEEFYMARSRHPQILRMKMGVKRDGTVIASQLDGAGHHGRVRQPLHHGAGQYRQQGAAALPRAAHAFRMPRGLHQRAGGRRVPRLRLPAGLLRAGDAGGRDRARTGDRPAGFPSQEMIRLGDTDLLSAQLGEGKEGLPRLVRSCGLPECMEARRGAIGWEQKRKSLPNGHSHLRRGVGMACTMQGSGIAGVDWASAFLKMNEDGSFFLQVGASDVGAGADTVLSQIAAETLGVSLDKIIITSGDTDITPFDVGAYASSTTIISGGAVKKAAEKVRAQVLELAAKMLDAPVDQLDCANNEVFTTCPCRKSVTMGDLAMQAMYKEKTADHGWRFALQYRQPAALLRHVCRGGGGYRDRPGTRAAPGDGGGSRHGHQPDAGGGSGGRRGGAGAGLCAHRGIGARCARAGR